MGIETGSFIEDLDNTWPPGGDGLFEADDHIRLVKSILKTQFPGSVGQGFNKTILSNEDELNHSVGLSGNIQSQINSLQALITSISNAVVPIGGIIMYNGLFANIPTSFQLCDGTSGTPDLTDRFVYGTNTQSEVLDVGGFGDSSLPSHNHVFYGQALPGHVHQMKSRDLMTTQSGGAVVPQDTLSNSTTNTNSASAGIPAGTLSSSGSSVIGKNIPPYVKLAYIQRMI